jgi:type I restriction enzyme S subunit
MDSESNCFPVIQLGELIGDNCFQNGLYKHHVAYGRGTPIIRINDFDNTGGFEANNLSLVEVSINELRQYEVRKKDILINRVNSLSHVGKSMFVDDIVEQMVYESNMMRLRIEPDMPLIPEYVATVLQAPSIRNYLRRVAKRAVAQVSINQGDICSIPVPVYPKPIQCQACTALKAWSTAIELTEKLIEAKEKKLGYHVSLMEKIAKKSRAHVRDVAFEISARNQNARCQRVLSVTNNRGFVLPADQFERRVASENLSNYKIVTQGQYAYNPSRINVGSIARLDDWDEGVLSPMYVVFKVKEKKINSDYFLHWLSSHEARERIKRSAQGSVRETVSFSDFGAISLPLPDLKTQDKIAKAINAMKREITLLRQLADAYRRQKRGLMQKLLTGEWKVRAKEEIQL